MWSCSRSSSKAAQSYEALLKHSSNALKLPPEFDDFSSSSTHISTVGIGNALIAFNSISATSCGGFPQDPQPNGVRIKWFMFMAAAAPRITKHLITLHQGLVTRVLVLKVLAEVRFVHCGCCNGMHLPGRKVCISLIFGVSEDAHVRMNAAAHFF